MSAHRFRFLGERDAQGIWIVSDPDEVQHLVKVLRLPAGAEVEATDGAGRWMRGTVAHADGVRRVSLAVGEEGHAEPARISLVLLLGALKHGAIDELLPSLTELGLNELRVFSQPGSDKSRLSSKVEARWHRIATQALKQCKRDYALKLTLHDGIEQATTCVGDSPFTEKLLLLPGAPVSFFDAATKALYGSATRSVMMAVGGEQGWADSELKTLQQNGFTAVHAGTGILRAVTAALAASSVAALIRG